MDWRILGEGMPSLDIVTTLCIGLLVGVELAVSAFINPVVWKLERAAQADAIRLFASRLGKAMPPWYVVSLLLLIAEAVVHRGKTAGLLLIIASVIWVLVILVTVLFLVPINNRMVQLNAESFTDEAKRQHTRWDTLHRLRVLALAVSLVCLLVANRL
jgi:uncharacterized membrane protein